MGIMIFDLKNNKKYGAVWYRRNGRIHFLYIDYSNEKDYKKVFKSKKQMLDFIKKLSNNGIAIIY
jgi:DNA-dependent RNA polymerase auxiliary subunit epsilon